MDATTLPTALAHPGAYPHPVGKITWIETHVSWVFFAGDHVYKVKKAVDLGFIDARTLEQRRRFCEDELRLNRRFPGDIHQAVVPVVRRDGGLAVFGEGEVVNFAVVMRRLPEDGMLDVLLREGRVDNVMIGKIAAALAAFHAAAATGPGVDEYGQPSAIAGLAFDNLTALAPFTKGPDAVLSEALHDSLTRGTKAFLEENDAFLRERVIAGRIREGHGDLHAGNICFEGDAPLFYDCIEFSQALRCGDVAADIAFLAMDLDRRSFTGFRNFLVREYVSASNDDGLLRVLPFYQAYRALVRAKVATLRFTGDPAKDAGSRDEAAAFTRLAGCSDLPPSLVLMCGLPGCGKSYVAARLDVPLAARVIRSDVVRKQLVGIPPTAKPPEEVAGDLYGPAMSERTYGALLRETEHRLRVGQSTVVDAAFMKAAQRRPFLELAERLRAPVALMWLVASEDVTLERLAQRAMARSDASEADAEVYQRTKLTFEPPSEMPSAHVVEAGGQVPPEVLSARLLDCLRAQV